MKNVTFLLMGLYFSIAASPYCFASTDVGVIHPAAVFDFTETGNNPSGIGQKIAALVFAHLAADPTIALVDREELGKLEDEAMLNLSGMVNTQQANQIGQLTGAKIIVTGSVFTIDDRLMLVSKIIGTETSRVLGAAVKGNASDNIGDLAEALSAKIAATITSNSNMLVAPPGSKEERVAVLKTKLQSGGLPRVGIDIKEHHINRAASDPAAETEMTAYCLESGFEVVDVTTENKRQADVLITGEGFTEFATRKGDLIGVKARLEVKAVEQTSGRVLAIDRQTELEVDLSELIAAKKALQRASARIAERLLPKIAGR